MKLIQAEQKEAWEAFQTAQPYAQFLQSWVWGEFQNSYGRPVRRFALLDESGAWLAAVQLNYRKKYPGSGYWFAPRGPVFSSRLEPDERRGVMLALCEELLKRRELRRRTLFWRLEPVSELAEPEGLVPLSFRRSDSQNPASTLLIDLSLPREELQQDMHEKTRYNIKVAERHGVRVRVVEREEQIEKFFDLMDETAKRDGLVQHPREYLAATYRELKAANMARIRVAEQDGVMLAASLEVAYGDTVTYLYGASSSAARNLMAPYALHAQAIQEAKVLGYRFYDMGGINPWSKAAYYYKPSWEGITRFKRGWGGRAVDLVGTWDLPFNIYLYRLAFIRKFFRG